MCIRDRAALGLPPDHGGLDRDQSEPAPGPRLIVGERAVAQVPVSYTHLDVYKRQATKISTQDRLPPGCPEPALYIICLLYTSTSITIINLVLHIYTIYFI